MTPEFTISECVGSAHTFRRGAPPPPPPIQRTVPILQRVDRATAALKRCKVTPRLVRGPGKAVKLCRYCKQKPTARIRYEYRDRPTVIPVCREHAARFKRTHPTKS